MKKMTKVFSLALAASLVVASLTACGGDGAAETKAETSSAGETAADGETTAASADGDVFMIGGIGPVTGSAASYGNSVKQGAEIAIKEINEAGGVTVGDKTYTLDMVFADDEATEDKAIQAYNSVMDQGAQAILGCVTSGACIAITDLTAADYESCGCISYFQEQKKQGKIRHFGFSFHGTPDCLRRLLETYSWDFVQIQLNYYDWYQGTAKQQYEILREHDVPVMVMEPVHGGMLASLPEDCMELLPKGNGSPAAWALRFAMDLPGIAVVLSGMSDMEQVKENIITADSGQSLTGAELSQLARISEKLRKKIAVPCTGCRYCCDNCPQGLDIPSLLSAYNDYRDEAAALGDKNMAVWRLHRLKALEKEKQPAACIGCGSCTAHCPQGLDIPAYMQEMSALLQ